MVRVTTGPNHTTPSPILEKRAPAVLVGWFSERLLPWRACEHGSVSPGGAAENCHWRKRRRSLAEDGILAPHAARDRQATLGVRMVGGDGPNLRMVFLPTRLIEPAPVPQDYARKFPASRINRNPLPLERPPQPAAMSLHWLPETFGWIQLAKGYEKRTQHCT
ncbi:hypothetical protein F5144DRAFT_656671 [Chaetomium tenue]|uniref:Uncharacterized protein n=1 Tax=Chaetomium tenue TaxID=1854479 RepID=A0ACB7NXM5_9PEZI|nr:hypothetical protein F5144DRAFT_656671 [Chaetomium globosum]